MSHGRIETQGKVADLRAQGSLNNVVGTGGSGRTESESDAGCDAALESLSEAPLSAGFQKELSKSPAFEGQVEGAVRWSTFKTYLKASCVLSLPFLLSHMADYLQFLLHMGHRHHLHRFDSSEQE